MTGYLHSDYAESLTEFGTPRFLSRSRGWILQRQIPGSSWCDGMGCYPLFACQDWARLSEDIAILSRTLVSLTMVTDPFGTFDLESLRNEFDVFVPFKHHHICDLSRPMNTVVSENHIRNARKSLADLEIHKCAEPSAHTSEWYALYANLIRKHHIAGIAAFSRESFKKQLRVPGIVSFRALHNHECVGMNLWYIQGDIAYYHLGAYSGIGYRYRASFGLFWTAFQHFAGSGLRWVMLGAGTGIQDDTHSGLTRFKRGWSSGTRIAYLCGRIFDQHRYDQAVRLKGSLETRYFPAYRNGEFKSPLDDDQT